MATSGKAWRKAREEGIEVPLASGNVVALRPIEVVFFLKVGHIPDALAETVTKLIQGDTVKFEIPAAEREAQSKEWLTFLDELVRFAFVNPKVVENPQADDEIALADVSYFDKLTVYRFFCQPASFLRRFHDMQTQPLAGVAPATGNGQTGQPVLQDQ